MVKIYDPLFLFIYFTTGAKSSFSFDMVMFVHHWSGKIINQLKHTGPVKTCKEKVGDLYQTSLEGLTIKRCYLTIRPVSRKGYWSIAHEAKPNGLLTSERSLSDVT